MTSTVKLYSFTYSIAGSMYSGHIPAMSWAEAETLVPFALVDGEIEGEYTPNACAICSGTATQDLTQPMPVQDYVWDDVIGD